MAAVPCPTRHAGRGGARNSASRRSFALTSAQIRNLTAAAAHARSIGLPFTRFITIHWKIAGIACDAMAKATGRFLDLLTKALARHGQSTAWIYVHESGAREGWHCHMLVHVPANLASVVTRRQCRWIRSITGRKYQADAINSYQIGRKAGIENSNPKLYVTNLNVTLAYLIKQADDKAVCTFNLGQHCPGLVIGKRAGTSQNIGAAARRHAPAA